MHSTGLFSHRSQWLSQGWKPCLLVLSATLVLPLIAWLHLGCYGQRQAGRSGQHPREGVPRWSSQIPREGVPGLRRPQDKEARGERGGWRQVQVRPQGPRGMRRVPVQAGAARARLPAGRLGAAGFPRLLGWWRSESGSNAFAGPSPATSPAPSGLPAAPFTRTESGKWVSSRRMPTFYPHSAAWGQPNQCQAVGARHGRACLVLGGDGNEGRVPAVQAPRGQGRGQ